MAITRHGTGHRASIAAAASQIHPVFMLPPLAASLFGGLLAGRLAALPAALHLAAVFCALYVAHVKDGYVDFHRRGEDEDHPLTVAGCRALLVAGTAGFAAATVAVGVHVGAGAAALCLPGWVIGYLHAPQLDTGPVTATAGYPLGVAFALVGGNYVQPGTVPVAVVALAVTLFVLLSGIKVVDDAADYEYDRSVDKRTVAVVLGVERARGVAHALFAVASGTIVGLALGGLFPKSAALAPLPFVAVALAGRRAEPELATMLLVRGAYVLLAVLVAAVWFRPLA